MTGTWTCRLIVTDLCVLDFGGANHAIRVRSLHPGVSLDQVQAATGFALEASAAVPTTAGPSAEQLAIIRKLDPHGMRATVIKGNPSAFAPRAPAKAS